VTFSLSNRNLFHEGNLQCNLSYNRDYSLETLQKQASVLLRRPIVYDFVFLDFSLRLIEGLPAAHSSHSWARIKVLLH
jgi:hypothetical protein